MKKRGTPQKTFRWPLLEELRKAGGRMHVHDIRRVMRRYCNPSLEDSDTELLSGGRERWWVNVVWERLALKEEGYISRHSPRGTWELTDEGREALLSHQRK